MAQIKEARVPDIGDYSDVPVIEVLVAVGDTVAKDQGLVTLESDKATLEVPSAFAGIVREIKVKLGDNLSEGALVAMIEAVEDSAAAPAPAPAAAAPAPAPAEVRNDPVVEPVAVAAEPDRLAAREIASAGGVSAGEPNSPPVAFNAVQSALCHPGGARVRPRAGGGPDAGGRQ